MVGGRPLLRSASEEIAGGASSAQRTVSGMRSPVNWALLGLVIQRPSYGYELVQRFERTFADGLELSSPSQIYTALDSLATRGLIEKILTPNGPTVAEVRQPKPHYKATERGVSGYCDWLLSQMGQERRRRRLLSQQLALLGARTALTVIEHCEHACLREASAMRSRPPAAGGPSEASSALVERLVAEEDRLRIGARLDWLRYARRELMALVDA